MNNLSLNTINDENIIELYFSITKVNHETAQLLTSIIIRCELKGAGGSGEGGDEDTGSILVVTMATSKDLPLRSIQV